LFFCSEFGVLAEQTYLATQKSWKEEIVRTFREIKRQDEAEQEEMASFAPRFGRAPRVMGDDIFTEDAVDWQQIAARQVSIQSPAHIVSRGASRTDSSSSVTRKFEQLAELERQLRERYYS
jgi:hypothetical protein